MRKEYPSSAWLLLPDDGQSGSYRLARCISNEIRVWHPSYDQTPLMGENVVPCRFLVTNLENFLEARFWTTFEILDNCLRMISSFIIRHLSLASGESLR